MTDAPSHEPIPLIGSIAELATTSEAWLVDVWGVMHNGEKPFLAACEACRKFRMAGGYVVLVTNAPRPAQSVIAQMNKIGVPQNAYDGLVSSGDVTRGLVEAWQDKPIHHLGPDRDRSLFEGLSVNFATSIEAEVVVCTGLFDDVTETPADYQTTLKGFERRGIVMICANPDIRVQRGDTIYYCAGALAEAYEELGGEVIYSGKPHLPIYELARGIVDQGKQRAVPRERIIAIGDGVLTDIPGAAAAGLRSLYVASGIHVEDADALDSAQLEGLFADLPVGRPVAAMKALAW